jgi:hypothetical protein
MKTIGFGSRATGIGLTVAMLAGCGGAQTTGTAVTPQGALKLTQAREAPRSWMKPGSSDSDLVYIASGNDVYVYGYPHGKQVGELTGFNDASGACSDSNGNVWITNAFQDSYAGGTLVEYAHGGTAPIATLEDQGYFVPVACSVDPSTGNLAAANSHRAGSPYPIAVWTGAEGSPTLYPPTRGVTANNPFTISYSGNGDLYIRSERYRSGEAWLPKGSSAIMQFDIVKRAFYGWDGQYFVMSGLPERKPWLMTRYTLNGGQGTVAGKVKLSYTSCRPSGAFSIQRSELAVICDEAVGGHHDEGNGVAYYDYPSGGDPVAVISGVAAYGVAISVAPSHSRIRK